MAKHGSKTVGNLPVFHKAPEAYVANSSVCDFKEQKSQTKPGFLSGCQIAPFNKALLKPAAALQQSRENQGIST